MYHVALSIAASWDSNKGLFSSMQQQSAQFKEMSKAKSMRNVFLSDQFISSDGVAYVDTSHTFSGSSYKIEWSEFVHHEKLLA